MRPPNPHHYDSKDDYLEAREAHFAYLDGKSHQTQPLTVRQRLNAKDPDSNYFEYD